MRDYERIGKFIYAFHRICGSVDHLNAFARSAKAAPDIAARAARLAQRFDLILESGATCTDAEFEEVLREAADVMNG